MPVAFFGASGRPDAAIAALMYSWGAISPVRLVRIVLPDEASLSEDRSEAAVGLIIEQHLARDPSEAATVALDTLGHGHDRRLVLDLPGSLAANVQVRSRLTLGVLVCGPKPLDETAALMAHDRASRIWTADGASPTWVLGCGRSGGAPAARSFSTDFATAAREAEIEPARICPFILPPLSHLQACWLEIGILDERVGALSKAFAEALDAIRAAPAADATPPDGLLLADDRGPEDRLREVADDLDAFKSGLWPRADALREAPILEGWSYATTPRKVLTGTIGPGHPIVRPGRKVVTSELFASDGATWARTLSRTYRLGAKSG